MKCPKCAHGKYNTIRSEPYTQHRSRILCCRKCNHKWQTTEEYDQRLQTIVFLTEKSHPVFNKRLRLVISSKNVIETFEIIEGMTIPQTLDLFAEAI